MSGDVTIKVEGLKEIERALVELGNVFAPRIMAKAIRGPMLRVRDAARSRVQKRTGALYDAIDLTPARRATARRASMSDTLTEVGIRIKKITKIRAGTGGGATNMQPRSYWHLVEWGTSHSSAHPYLRPSWDENESSLAPDAAKTMREEIDKVRRRSARGRR